MNRWRLFGNALTHRMCTHLICKIAKIVSFLQRNVCNMFMLTFRADFEQIDVEHDFNLLAIPVDCVCCGIAGAFAAELGDNGSPASCWLLLIESVWANGPFAAAEVPSSVTRTLGARFRPRGLNIVGISPSRVIVHCCPADFGALKRFATKLSFTDCCNCLFQSGTWHRTFSPLRRTSITVWCGARRRDARIFTSCAFNMQLCARQFPVLSAWAFPHELKASEMFLVFTVWI